MDFSEMSTQLNTIANGLEELSKKDKQDEVVVCNLIDRCRVVCYNLFKAKGKEKPFYTVELVNRTCTCPSFRYNRFCKHLRKAEIEQHKHQRQFVPISTDEIMKTMDQ